MRSLAFLAVVGFAAAQTTQLFNFTFNVALVDSVEKSKKIPSIYSFFSVERILTGVLPLGNWCSGERNTCQSLCPGRETANTCDPVCDSPCNQLDAGAFSGAMGSKGAQGRC
jgi:hypothetical protein